MIGEVGAVTVAELGYASALLVPVDVLRTNGRALDLAEELRLDARWIDHARRRCTHYRGGICGKSNVSRGCSLSTRLNVSRKKY